MNMPSWFRKSALAALAFAALSGLASPPDAQAWWRGGVWVGVPLPYFAPPIYAPPPVYYAPPPVVYAPQPFYVAPPQAQRYSQTCYAGPYTCPLEPPGPAGSSCSCPSNQGRAYGRAG